MPGTSFQVQWHINVHLKCTSLCINALTSSSASKNLLYQWQIMYNIFVSQQCEDIQYTSMYVVRTHWVWYMQIYVIQNKQNYNLYSVKEAILLFYLCSMFPLIPFRHSKSITGFVIYRITRSCCKAWQTYFYFIQPSFSKLHFSKHDTAHGLIRFLTSPKNIS